MTRPLPGDRPSDLLRGRAIPDAVLAGLPKTDLHVHLDGSLRLATFRELGRAVGLDVPDADTDVWRTFFPGGRPSGQLEFLALFEHTLAVLQRPEHLERAAYELACDHAADGCWYLETRFCPLLHTREGMSADDAVAAVRRGLDRVASETSFSSGIILTGLRTIAPAGSLELAELAVAWKGRGVVGFDLAGAEEHYPAKDHRQAFYHVMNHNQNVTIHAGEGFGPASIHQALHWCGANRIGHATRLPEDPDLMAYVADHRVPLEICPSSSVASGLIDELAEHPLRTFMQEGLRVCLGTDNTLFVRTSPQRELRRVVDVFDLTLLETEHLLLSGFKSAFQPEKEKARLIEDALATFTSLRDKHGLDELMLGTKA